METTTTTRRRWPWVAGIAAALLLTACADTTAELVEPEPTVESSAPEVEPVAEETAEPEPEPKPEPEPEPEPDSTVGEIGDTATMTQDWGDGSTVGTITVSAVEVSTRPASEYGDAPKNGVFVIFTVDIAADGDKFDVYAGDFYVRGEDGTRWDEGEGNSWDAVADYDDMLGWVELNAGERKSGLIVFDLPEAAGELAYAPNYDGGPIVSWLFEESS